MYKLVLFLKNHKHWFLWLLLQGISLLLLLNSSVYHTSLRLYGTNEVLGHLQETMTEMHSYLNLREQNRVLLEQNARLEHEHLALVRRVRDAEAQGKLPSLELPTLGHKSAELQTARVVNLRHSLGEVYYVINRGSKHGIRIDMPVLSEGGVVGTVMSTSESYSIVIPIINAKLKLSCVVKNKGYQGTLSSSGLHGRSLLGDISMHSNIEPGDTILTSGLSYIYPEGLFVGQVENEVRDGISSSDAAFGTYSVRLATDFHSLSYVYVLLTPPMDEPKALEDGIAITE